MQRNERENRKSALVAKLADTINQLKTAQDAIAGLDKEGTDWDETEVANYLETLANVIVDCAEEVRDNLA